MIESALSSWSVQLSAATLQDLGFVTSNGSSSCRFPALLHQRKQKTRLTIVGWHHWLRHPATGTSRCTLAGGLAHRNAQTTAAGRQRNARLKQEKPAVGCRWGAGQQQTARDARAGVWRDGDGKQGGRAWTGRVGRACAEAGAASHARGRTHVRKQNGVQASLKRWNRTPRRKVTAAACHCLLRSDDTRRFGPFGRSQREGAWNAHHARRASPSRAGKTSNDARC